MIETDKWKMEEKELKVYEMEKRALGNKVRWREERWRKDVEWSDIEERVNEMEKWVRRGDRVENEIQRWLKWRKEYFKKVESAREGEQSKECGKYSKEDGVKSDDMKSS